jgi:hypothetical protein
MAIEDINLPGLATVTQLLYQLLAGTQVSRLLQAANAPQIVAENSGTLTDAAVVAITEAAQLTTAFSFLVVVFDEAAGTGRYSYIKQPTAAGAGFQIAAGGGNLVIFGSQNIQRFKMIAETGQTLGYTYGLYL